MAMILVVLAVFVVRGAKPSSSPGTRVGIPSLQQPEARLDCGQRSAHAAGSNLFVLFIILLRASCVVDVFFFKYIHTILSGRTSSSSEVPTPKVRRRMQRRHAPQTSGGCQQQSD